MKRVDKWIVILSLTAAVTLAYQELGWSSGLWTAELDLNTDTWSATKRTEGWIYYPQLALDSINNKLYFVYLREGGERRNQIWTAQLDLDTDTWSTTQRTEGYGCESPQLVLDSKNNKLYYIYSEYSEYGGMNEQIWTAEMNTDGTGWKATQRIKGSSPHLVLDSKNSKIYFSYTGSSMSLWTAEMKTDGTGWKATERGKDPSPPLVLDSVNNKVYYTYYKYVSPNWQIWTAELDLSTNTWTPTQRTTTNYDSKVPQLALDSINNKLYFVYLEEKYGEKNQLWTAEMKTDGTGWSATQRIITSYDIGYPQLILDSANNKNYYAWHYGGSIGGYYVCHCWTAEMKTDGTGWKATQRTSASANESSRFLQLVLDSENNKLYFAYEDPIKDRDSDKDKEWYKCAIITSAYGTPLAKEVKALSAFKDRYLLTNKAGQVLVKFYYRHSLKIADFIRDKELLKAIVREALRPLVRLTKRL